MVESNMWYRADLLFAQLPKESKPSVKCESCNVLFKALSAVEAYDKAVRWAATHVEDSIFQFVGVEHIQHLGEERPGEGSEIAGAFFDDENVWERKNELIPEKSKIPAIIWEQNGDVPIGELRTERQKKDIREIFGEE
jgi:hypothetical protein